MPIHANSSCLGGQAIGADDEEQSERSLGGRLIRLVIAGEGRKSNRRILMYLPNHDSLRRQFGPDLERRLLRQWAA